MGSLKTLYVTNRDEWRKWLERNCETEKEVWLLYYKRDSGKPSIPYEDTVEEALCFGWIDSIIKKVDDERYVRKFTPRKNTSNWSDLNKKRVRKMIKEGKMTETGLEKINLSELEKKEEKKKKQKLVIPSFVKEAFIAENVWGNFCNLAPTYRDHYIGWITSAKREETRQRRLEEAVELLQQNKKLPMK